MTAMLRSYLALRTSVFDKAVVAAVTQPPCQVVIVGAGYDDRSLRFRTPGVHFFEVDHPATQRDKVDRLRARDIHCDDITFVPTDLEDDPSLARVADVLSPDQKTFVLCEAVVPYLEQSTIQRMVGGLASLPGRERTLTIEVGTDPTTPAGRLALTALTVGARLAGETIRTSFKSAEEAESLLTTAGWHILDRTTGADLHMRAATSDVAYLTASTEAPDLAS